MDFASTDSCRLLRFLAVASTGTLQPECETTLEILFDRNETNLLNKTNKSTSRSKNRSREKKKRPLFENLGVPGSLIQIVGDWFRTRRGVAGGRGLVLTWVSYNASG